MKTMMNKISHAVVTTYEYTTPHKDIYWFFIKLKIEHAEAWRNVDGVAEHFFGIQDHLEPMCQGKLLFETTSFRELLIHFADRQDFFLAKLIV